MDNFIINQDSGWWTGLGDRLFIVFSPCQFPKELGVTPGKRLSLWVLARRFFLYNVSQPQLGSSTTTRVIPMNLSWPYCPSDGENCQDIPPEHWGVKSGSTQPSHCTLVASGEVIPLGIANGNDPDAIRLQKLRRYH